MLEPAGEDQEIRRWPLHPHQAAVRDIQVDLPGHTLRWRKDRIKAALAKNMPDEVRHRVFICCLCRGSIWVGFLCFLKELFAPKMKQNVNRGKGDDHFVDGECTWIRQKANALSVS